MLTDKFIQAGQWQAEAVEILQRITIMEILLVFIYLIKLLARTNVFDNIKMKKYVVLAKMIPSTFL
jgi:hypothetical protein